MMGRSSGDVGAKALDLPRLRISAAGAAQRFEEAIREAGYTPVAAAG